MASFHYISIKNPLLLYILLFLFASSLLVPTFSQSHKRRNMLALDVEEEEVEEAPQSKKKTNLQMLVSKNQTKSIKPTTTTNSTKPAIITIITTTKKLNSTTNTSNSTKRSLDLPKPSTPKNKTQLEQKPKSQSLKPIRPILPNLDDDDDLVSDIKGLPSRFQQTLLPDLERISVTSRAYIHQANREISDSLFKPIVGKQYAPTLSSILCSTFIFLPLLLVSLVFNRFKAYFSLQKIILFIQVYLSIYFSILSLASLLTGLEPLNFFYATSQSVYTALQVLQTLGYVLYLLLLLMYLVLVFGTETGFGLKVLGLGQTLVGFAVGLHYYVAVFHRAVLHQAPRTNWKIHGIYATFFLLICLLANVERRKKAYLEDGGEEGKKK